MKLYYRKEGKGPVIVVIHGLYGSSDNWMNMGKRLAENHTVYMIDQRNHGRSPFADEQSFDAMRDDLAEFFNTHEIEKAIIIGHSMGGKTAMWFAADYPEKVEKLVIADIAPKDYTQHKDSSQYHLHRNILLAMQELDFSKIKKRKEVDKLLSERIDSARIRQFLLKNVTKDKKTKKYRWRLNVDVLYEYLDEIVGGVNLKWFEDRIPITTYPVVFIRGLESNYIMDEDFELIKKIYPEASIKDIPGAGHWLHAEKPDEFMDAVVKCC
ncbi:Pimeloyl-ACP methyl ester carboxylesterase [Tangfeifania diversioriginum]|uniref:Pimeloyl-ACP methyl ester carboxylesterase n=1 Tax=Tangfeifania diversioriginum TaxID=1168035 RepID=A0A1M6KRA6_9BACT|nr:alpha/beta fold hydrolase [Tangfeifania diversioriginum]SHJ61410.1 Pimeloyl-ACP methyl ester carboxylesterase [Tangfeifania diversioriginum]